jgi:pimeloyl-ACP methyl ester carboxylesterase
METNRMGRVLVGLLLLSVFSAAAEPLLAQGGQSQPERDGADLDRLLAAMAFLRDRNARDYAITSPNGIDDARYVEIGGIQQWITIRGEDRKNPVLLFLHGGPGDATNPWAYAVFRPWHKHFTVVQWDQRGAARTLGKNPRSLAETITIDRMAQDGIELAQALRKLLGQDRIILVGHSWGSILGVFMAKARPDLFCAFVGTGLVADPANNYSVAYRGLLAKAAALGEQGAIRELREVGPPPYSAGREYAVLRKWSNFFEGADVFIAAMFGHALSAPRYTVRDINDWLDGQNLSAERLVPQTSALGPRTLGGDFAVPVFVIQGAEDFTTPTALARSFVDSIRAPRKAFVAIEGGGHFAVFMRSNAFLRELVSRVRPLAEHR